MNPAVGNIALSLNAGLVDGDTTIQRGGDPLQAVKASRKCGILMGPATQLAEGDADRFADADPVFDALSDFNNTALAGLGPSQFFCKVCQVAEVGGDNASR